MGTSRNQLQISRIAFYHYAVLLSRQRDGTNCFPDAVSQRFQTCWIADFEWATAFHLSPRRIRERQCGFANLMTRRNSKSAFLLRLRRPLNPSVLRDEGSGSRRSIVQG